MFDDYTLRAMSVDTDSMTVAQVAFLGHREHLLRCRFGWAGETLASDPPRCNYAMTLAGDALFGGGEAPRGQMPGD